MFWDDDTFAAPLPSLLGETGDDVVTGGERPTLQQREACDALLPWLIGLLAAMPLNQSLLQRTNTPLAAAAASASATAANAPGQTAPPSSPPPASSAESREEDKAGRGVVDAETERVRRSMREEARSAVLKTLAALLAGSGDEVRHAATQPRTPRGVRGACDSIPPPLPPPTLPTAAQPETRLVPLCLRLLRGCGGAAEPKPKPATPGRRRAPVTAAAAVARPGLPPPGREGEATRAAEMVGGLRGVPAGRKAELLQVIGNACFRCQAAQDLAREEGGLPLVLNHCGVDEANPLLR